MLGIDVEEGIEVEATAGGGIPDGSGRAGVGSGGPVPLDAATARKCSAGVVYATGGGGNMIAGGGAGRGGTPGTPWGTAGVAVVAVAPPCFGPAFALSDGVLLRSVDLPRGRGGGGPAGGLPEVSASGTDPEESEGDGNSSLELSGGAAFAAAALASAFAPLRRVVFGAMLPRECRGSLTADAAILVETARQNVSTAG